MKSPIGAHQTALETPDALEDVPPSASSRFRQLSPQKQFAFVTLAAMGTAMLITGRTVRAIMKRIPKSDPALCPQELSNTIRPSSASSIPRSAPTTTQSGRNFWDNKSLLCRPHPQTPPKSEDMNFNPASDAAAALGIATCLVIGTTTLAIRTLGNRWQLDGWEDWRMFIQSGHLRTAMLPENWNQTASSLIPDRLRPRAESADSSEEIDPEQWDWKRSADAEWMREQNRRQNERIEWEKQRQLVGKRVW